jgi:hypothetical protein
VTEVIKLLKTPRAKLGKMERSSLDEPVVTNLLFSPELLAAWESRNVRVAGVLAPDPTRPNTPRIVVRVLNTHFKGMVEVQYPDDGIPVALVYGDNKIEKEKTKTPVQSTQDLIEIVADLIRIREHA